MATHEQIEAPFLQTGNVLVEGIQQGLIFTAESLIGVAYHLCRDESLTV